ncbi:MAG: hypothetical protein R2694_20510 [Ilumatobacteraceae bacterium]|nr:hypothetical protein [Ilumatobacter sp.]MCB0985802.1 hypothetical protein [Ilumatobacter sp.]
MSVFGTVGHLARRFATSLSRRPPAADDLAWAHAMLLPSEAALWDRMTAQDRRHSILVARRFVERLPDATRPEVAAALLHDVGKLEAGLGTFARVAATVVGPRGRRFRAYHDHEAIGAGLLADAGSDTVTVSLVTGHGRAAEVLRAADDV